jgi:hypothetical protein
MRFTAIFPSISYDQTELHGYRSDCGLEIMIILILDNFNFFK